MTISAQKQYAYDVALSFAGEDRNYADALAKALFHRRLNVFYDTYEKSTLWGRNLYTYLSDIYQNKSCYCVMFLSQHYASKLWTNHEREAAQARAFRENKEYILPVRLDNTTIPGIPQTIAYLSWPPENAETIADAIMAKFNKEPLRTEKTISIFNKIAPPTIFPFEPIVMFQKHEAELLSLIFRLEQDFTRQHGLLEQVTALATYINLMMDVLTEAYRTNGAELPLNTLEVLLSRNNLRFLGTYQFIIIKRNNIDLKHFTALCREVLRSLKGFSFLAEAFIVLPQILSCIFNFINAHVVPASERLENQEIWEASFVGMLMSSYAR